MTEDTDIIRKIKALLAKAKGTSNENEAVAFAEKASELMAKHEIDPKDIDENTIRYRAGQKRINEKWWANIALVTGRMFNCYFYRDVYWHPKRNGAGLSESQRFMFVGRQNDAITAELMTDFFISTIMKMGVKYMKENNCTRKVRDQYVRACALRLGQRILLASKNTSDSRHLTLVEEEVRAKLELKSGKPSTGIDFSNAAAQEGWEDGDGIGINVQAKHDSEGNLRVTQTVKIGGS